MKDKKDLIDLCKGLLYKNSLNLMREVDSVKRLYDPSEIVINLEKKGEDYHCSIYIPREDFKIK